MTSFDGEDTIHLGEVQDDRTASEDSNVPVGGGEEFSQASVHYSEASSSVLTTTPVCDDHNGEHTLDFNRDAVSVKDIHPESSSEIPPSDEIDEVSITSTLVTNPSVVSGSVVSAHSNYTENSISSSYETSSHRGAKLNLDFLPVRNTSRSSGGSVYSRSSSKRSVRRRDVIKPVALPPTQAPNNHELDSCPTYTNYSAANNNLALVVHGTQPKGMEPPETTRGGGCDPPGEEPSSRPSPSLPSHGNKFRSVQWVDPKNIADEREIDHDMLNRYRELSNDCSSYDPDINELMGEKRIRIATISSGYKTANFFVREDLDQRIYFHELEDAVSYMARRGYARMEKGQEKEWMKLLKRAHEVVKVGPTKKKQRYRKGKLVLIMYKLIKDEVDHYSDIKKKSSQCSLSSEANTAHTSLGRSIRCGYKSYSEKFLAELETGKSNGVLMLTNGPTDAPSYYSSNASSGGGLLQLTNGLSATSIVEEEKSHSTVSDKRGVYGGGVRYFTPDKSYSEDGDEESNESEESDDDNEEKSASDDFIEVEGSDMGSMFSEDEESHRPSNDGVESVASSTVNSEMSSIARNQNGVYMASDNKYGNRNTLNKKRAPTPFDKSPDMVPISDESESGSWE
jgi:hypothetical protein